METMSADSTWTRVLGKIQSKVHAHSFDTWFKPTRMLSEDAHSLRVLVPNAWFAEWLRSNYVGLSSEALKDMDRPGVSVSFVTPDAGGPRPPESEPPPSRLVKAEPAGPALNPRYVFERFVHKTLLVWPVPANAVTAFA